MEWIKFEDKLPTEEYLEQVKILFGSPKWAACFQGLYSHLPDTELKDRVWLYNQKIDRYHSWGSAMPTHYAIITSIPKD